MADLSRQHGHNAWNWTKQWNAQRGRCWLCLQPMRLEPPSHPDAVSVEHIVPRARGGSNKWNNKLLAHRVCNTARGTPFIWVKLNAFRRAAMKRLNGLRLTTVVDGIDLVASHQFGRRKAYVHNRGSATLPSKMADKALRVPLAELSFPPQSTSAAEPK
jgi:HNH endonuclease